MSSLYLIKALTNMHVGSGSMSYDLIDNKVQRDVITGYPTIKSSSLKGALKNHFENKAYSDLLNVFGGKDGTIGRYKFFSANLLSIPVRSNKKPFFRAICPQIIEELVNYIEEFDIQYKFKNELDFLRKLVPQEKKPIIFEEIKDVIIEDFFAEFREIEDTYIKKLESLFGRNMVLFSNNDFATLMEELPVLARNKLENGESKNLWHEEIVPRESRFYFTILNEKIFLDSEFEKILLNRPIQIGANASIGYGYTKIEKLAGGKHE